MGIKKAWKYSKIRFYILNLRHNYSFWLHAKPLYAIKRYEVKTDTVDLDRILDDGGLLQRPKVEIKSYKKFIGYKYKGGIYLDNPGILGEPKDVWEAWVRKGVIKR